jgi:23S rRNA (guanosine2251-2'-O)-methyltransferase
MRCIYTGFHAIEEKIKRNAQRTPQRVAHNEHFGKQDDAASIRVVYAPPEGPRVKKILELAKQTGVHCQKITKEELDSLTAHLYDSAKDHRGIALVDEEDSPQSEYDLGVKEFLARRPPESRELTLILDSITDPHNIGAILRSACQFGCGLVVVPKHNALKDIRANETAARASAGAVSWTPLAVVPNLVRAAQQLKKAGFWIYGADAGSGAETLFQTQFAPRTAIVLGSEGQGISRLLAKECDALVSIPMSGKLGSLNVSVAAGIMLYEVFRQWHIHIT